VLAGGPFEKMGGGGSRGVRQVPIPICGEWDYLRSPSSTPSGWPVAAEKRKAYDASRGSKRSAFNEEAEAVDEAFEEPIHDYDERRDTACSLYPDLRKLKSSHAKTS
jgi:hypothetical protein